MSAPSLALVAQTLGPDLTAGAAAHLLFAHTTFAGVPTGNLVPAFIGQDCLDTANNDWYRAHGLTNADWKKLTP